MDRRFLSAVFLAIAGCAGVREGTVRVETPANPEYVVARDAARHPKDAAAWEKLAWFGLLESGDLQAASAAFTRALELEPGRPMSLWGRFLISEDHGDIAAALATARAILGGAEGFPFADLLVVRLRQLRDLGLSVAADEEVSTLLKLAARAAAEAEPAPGVAPAKTNSGPTNETSTSGAGPTALPEREAELWARYREAFLGRDGADADAPTRMAALRECHRLYPRFAHVGAELAGAESSLNLRWQAYRNALTKDPAHMRARVGLATLLLEKGFVQLASDEVDRALALYPRAPLVLVARARVELALGHTSAALRLCEDALFTAPQFLPALRLMVSAGRVTRSVAQQEQLARKALAIAPGDAELQASLSESLLQSGKLEEVPGSVRPPNEDAQVDAEQRRREIEALLQLDRERARAAIPSLLAEPRLENLLLARRIALAVGDENQARELLARAVALAPEDQRVQGSAILLDHVTATEAAGDRDEPWGAVPGDFDAHGFASLVLYNSRSVELRADGTVDTRRRLVARVLESRPELGRWTFDYDPDEQQIQVIRAERRGANGTLLEVARPRDEPSPLVSASQARLYLNHRKLSLVFATVNPDDLIDIEIATHGKGQSAGEWQGDIAVLGTGNPTWLGVYELTVPRGMKVAVDGFGPVPPTASKTEAADRTTFRFEAHGIPGVRLEGMMPNPIEKLPYVVASTSPSFEAISGWFRELASLDEPHASPAVTSLAHELCGEPDAAPTEPGAADSTTPAISAGRAQHVYDYVRDQIRYLGFEFGHYDFKPHSPEEVCHARYGDCKDQARLMVELLRNCGVEAEMVLLRTRSAGQVEDRIPYVGLFNHAIVYFPALDLYADSTAPNHRLGELPADDLDTLALRIRPGATLGRTPRPKAAEHTREVRMRLRLVGGAGQPIVAQGRREVTYTGLFCPPARAGFAAQPGSVEPLIIPAGPLEAGEIQLEDEPNRLHLSYRLRFPVGDEGLPLDLSPFGAAALIELSPGRVQPLRLRHPMTFRSEVELDLYGLDGTPEVPEPVSLKAPGASYRFEARMTKQNLLVLTEELILDRLDVPTSELAEWTELLRRVDALQRTTLRLVSPG